MPTVADVLAVELEEAGIDVVFGLPGGETIEVLDAFRRRGIRFVLVHHESAAVFMASTLARLSGRPGACMTTLGPGATNAVSGVAHAYLDRAPLLVITAQTSERMLPHHTHQVVDIEALYSPITKASLVLRARGAKETICQAIESSMSGRPGPVQLRLSNEDGASPVVVESARGIQQSPPPISEGAIRAESFEAASGLIARAKRPVIVAGLGLEPEGPYRELRRLAESAGAPLIVTAKAKGAIPDDHPLAAGTFGLTKSDPVGEILAEADCVLAIGLDVVELVRPWSHPAPLVWIAPWANEDPVLPAAAEIIGPMKPTLNRLAEVSSPRASDWGDKRVALHHRQHSRPVLASAPMSPRAVLSVLRESLPRDALITTDVGSHKILACLEWPAYVPNRFFVSNGLSSMGYSLPAAIASSLHGPESAVVCTTGDAGLAMVMGELGTLARLTGPVIVVVFKDGALDLIRSHQLRGGKPTFGTEFRPPDFVRVAEAHSIEACRVVDEEALARAVRRSLDGARPALIEVEIDTADYPTAPPR